MIDDLRLLEHDDLGDRRRRHHLGDHAPLDGGAGGAVNDKPKDGLTTWSPAGDRMTVRHDGDRTVISWDDKGTGRVCGGCTLCCKLLPALDLGKLAGQRCRHSRAGKGCAIYARRPKSCRTWACAWLANPDTAGMPRPDRAHYVIDVVLDQVIIQSNEDGSKRALGVIQVWVDPAFPDAHRAPELRAFMLREAEERGLATLIRYDEKRGFMVFPPPLCADGEWHEKGGDVLPEEQLQRELRGASGGLRLPL
jgi:hypothetical protein